MNETPAYWIFVSLALVNLISAFIGNAFDNPHLDVDRFVLFAIAWGVMAVAVKRGK